MKNMLLYTAIGDAYGLPFEFASDEYVSLHNDGLNYKSREKYTKGWEDHFPGRYSDDTDCSIATIQAMLMTDVLDVDCFITLWQGLIMRDPSRGYSKQTKEMLTKLPTKSIINGLRNSDSNGCLMGAHFLGLYPTEEQVLKASVNKCLPMHANPECISATSFLALTAHYIYHLKLDMSSALEQAVNKSGLKFNFDQKKRVPCQAGPTAQAVYHILIQTTHPHSVLTKAVQRGGDVDSVASIALGLSCLIDREETLPEELYKDLESYQIKPDTDGFGYLWNRLIAQYPKTDI